MKTFLILLFLSFSLVALAQVKQGSHLVGGTASFAYEVKPVKFFSYNFMPSYHYFVSNKFALGAYTGISGFKVNKTLGLLTESNVNFYIGPSLRYYLIPDKKLQPFLTAYAGYRRSNTKFRSFSDSQSGLDAGGGVGVSYFVKENLAFEVLLRYVSQQSQNSSNNQISINLAFGIQGLLSK
jgi:hypothetical protein